MRTKTFTTLAAAALLAVSSATAALAEAPDVQQSQTAFTAGANPSRNVSTNYGGFAPNIGPSAHFHPHGGNRGT